MASSGSSSSSFSSLAIAAACSPDRCSAAARFSVVFRLRSYTASCSAGSKPLRPSKLRTVFSYLDLASASLPPASSSFPSSLSFLASSSIAERLARCQLTGLSKLTSSATNSSATVSFPVNFAKAAKTAAAPGWSSPTYPCLGCRASFRVTRDTSPGTASLNDVSSASGRVPHPSVNSRGSPSASRVSNTGSSSSEKPLKPEGRTRTEKCARHAQSCTGQSAGNSPAPSFSLRLNTTPSPKRSRTWTMDSSANSNSTPAATPAAGTRLSPTTTSSRYAPGSHHTTHRSPTLMVSTAAERGAGSVPSPLTHRTRVLGANTDDAFGPSSFGSSVAHTRPTSSRTISNGGLGLSQPSPSLVTVLCTTGCGARSSSSSSLVRPRAPSVRVRVASIRIRVASLDARTDSTSSQTSSSKSTPRGHGRARGWRYAYVGWTRTTHRSPMDMDASASSRPLTHSCPG